MLGENSAQRYERAGEIVSALEAPQSGRIGKNTARWRTAGVIAGLVFAVASGSALYWLRHSSPAQPVATGVSGRPTIAVMGFEYVGGIQNQDNAWLSRGVPTMLLSGLAQTRGLDIVSSERLSEALKRRGGTSLASLDKSQAANVAREAGAGAVVFGSIFRAGADIRIDAQLEDLGSGRVLVAQSVRGTDLFALVDQLASRIRDGVGFRDAQDIRRLADVSTSSLEAYRLYSLAIDALENMRLDEAQKDLEDSVDFDPAFAEAYQQLAQVMELRLLPRRQGDYLRKAGEHAERLSERRRFLLNVQLARDAGDTVRAKSILDELLAKYPDVERAYSNASRLYSPRPGNSGNLQKLLQILSAGTSSLPASKDLRNNYGYALMTAHRYPEAIREFERTFVWPRAKRTRMTAWQKRTWLPARQRKPSRPTRGR